MAGMTGNQWLVPYTRTNLRKRQVKFALGWQANVSPKLQAQQRSGEPSTTLWLKTTTP
jgi:hypothetical protein